MTIRTTMKLLGLVLLAVVTVFVTSAAMALASKPPKTQRIAPLPRANDITTTLQERKPDGPDVDAPRGTLTKIHGLKVSVGGDALRVSGNALVSRIGRDPAYVFEVRVRLPRRGAIVASQRYDTQVFQVPEGQPDVDVPFDDLYKLPLAPGAYDVELVLYKVPTQGVALLDDPDMQRGHFLVKDTAKIKVGG